MKVIVLRNRVSRMKYSVSVPYTGIPTSERHGTKGKKRAHILEYTSAVTSNAVRSVHPGANSKWIIDQSDSMQKQSYVISMVNNDGKVCSVLWNEEKTKWSTIVQVIVVLRTTV